MKNVQLNKLSIQNFKAFGEMVDVPIRPITLIFGENSAGKSSILHSLLFVQQLSNDGVLSNIHFVSQNINLGGENSYAHNQNLDNSIDITVRNHLVWNSYITSENSIYTTHQAGHIGKTNKMPQLNTLEYAVHLSINLNNKSTSSIEYIINNHLVLRLSNIVQSNKDPNYYDVTCTIPKSLFLKWNLASTEYTNKHKRINTFGLLALDDGENNQQLNYVIDRYLNHIALITSAIIQEDNQFISFDMKLFKKYIYFSISNQLELLDSFGFKSYNTNYQITDKHGLINSTYHTIIEDLYATLSVINHHIDNSVRRFTHTGPLRIIPDRHIGIDTDKSTSSLYGNHAWEVIQNYPDVCNYVNQWLSRLKIPYILKRKLALDSKKLLLEIGRDVSQVISLQSIDAKTFLEQFYTVKQLYFENTSGKTALKLSPQDLGVGVSQVIPVIVNCVANSNTTVLIEQPELHLHPRLQGDLADLFIETAIKGDQLNTYVIETHSEHIIRRIMRRIREDRNKGTDEVRITKDDVAILYVAPGPNGSTVTHLRLDDEGDLIDEWPNGFFEESFRDDMAGR